MRDGARRTPFTTFNLCYKGAVTGMTYSQVTGTGKGKQTPTWKLSHKNRTVQIWSTFLGAVAPTDRLDLPLILCCDATCGSGVAWKTTQLLVLDLSSRVFRSDQFSLLSPGNHRVLESIHSERQMCRNKADLEIKWLPSLVISDENCSFSQWFINNCLFSALSSAVLKSKNGRSAIFSPINTTIHECTHALNTNLCTLTHACTHTHTVFWFFFSFLNCGRDQSHARSVQIKLSRRTKRQDFTSRVWFETRLPGIPNSFVLGPNSFVDCCCSDGLTFHWRALPFLSKHLHSQSCCSPRIQGARKLMCRGKACGSCLDMIQ